MPLEVAAGMVTGPGLFRFATAAAHSRGISTVDSMGPTMSSS